MITRGNREKEDNRSNEEGGENRRGNGSRWRREKSEKWKGH